MNTINSKAAPQLITFLENLMKRRRRLPSQLARDVGVSHPTVGRWLSGEDVPSTNSCRKLAIYSGTSVEKILSLSGHLPEIKIFSQRRGTVGNYELMVISQDRRRLETHPLNQLHGTLSPTESLETGLPN